MQPDFSLLTLNERDRPLHVIGCFAYNNGVSRWGKAKIPMSESFLFECSICWIKCMFDGKRSRVTVGKSGAQK